MESIIKSIETLGFYQTGRDTSINAISVDHDDIDTDDQIWIEYQDGEYIVSGSNHPLVEELEDYLFSL